jgi:hypothetical protein
VSGLGSGGIVQYALPGREKRRSSIERADLVSSCDRLAKQSFHFSASNFSNLKAGINTVIFIRSHNKSTQNLQPDKRFETIFLRNRSRQRCRMEASVSQELMQGIIYNFEGNFWS